MELFHQLQIFSHEQRDFYLIIPLNRRICSLNKSGIVKEYFMIIFFTHKSHAL